MALTQLVAGHNAGLVVLASELSTKGLKVAILDANEIFESILLNGAQAYNITQVSHRLILHTGHQKPTELWPSPVPEGSADVAELHTSPLSQRCPADVAAAAPQQLHLVVLQVTQPCFNQTTGSVCSNPENHLFWDSLHPTEAVHDLVGELLANEIAV